MHGNADRSQVFRCDAMVIVLLGSSDLLKTSEALEPSPLEKYHSFQNHYTHEITLFELFRRLQLQLSGVFQIN